MRRLFAAAVCALVLAGAGRAADEITIKIRKPGVGDVTKDTKTEDEDNTIVVTVMGMDNKRPEASKSKFVFTDEVLEKPADAKKPTKIKRTYETAERTKNGEAVDLGLAGKTVTIEKKGDKYTFTFADGSAVGAAAAELLDKEINKKSDVGDEMFIPKKPVKVGDSWAVDLALGAKELEEGGLTIDKDKSTATVTLSKAYDKGGKKFGVMDVKMTLVVTKASGGGMDIPMKDGSKLVVEASLDGCIDGTSAAGESKMKMTGDMAAEVMGTALKFDLKGMKVAKTEAVKEK
jgi:hypothetical protein